MTRVCWEPWESRGSWDQAIVEELTAGDGFDHGIGFAKDQGGIVVLAGQHLLDEADQLARFVRALPWALTIVTSDEEALFPIDLLPRDERHAVWNQYHDRGMDRVIPIGHPPGTLETLAEIGTIPRMGDVFFAGQDTHERRHELLAAMKDMAADPRRYGNVTWAATTGFRSGITRDRYLRAMRDTRIAPCPSGPHSLDSFRLYEALAAGCLPVIEAHTPHGDEHEFWDALFGDGHPIPRVSSWKRLPDVVEFWSLGFAWENRRDWVQRWWEGYREDLQIDFERTIARLRQS